MSGTADAVKCFHCDLGLAQWEDGDDPWVEHAKKAVDCNFLKLNKSKAFIDECKRIEHNCNYDSLQPNTAEMQTQEAEDELVCRVVDEWLSTDPLVQEFVSLNLYPIDLVKVVLNHRYYSHKRPFNSFADMYDTVSALAERSPSSRQSYENNRQTDNPLLNVIEMK